MFFEVMVIFNWHICILLNNCNTMQNCKLYSNVMNVSLANFCVKNFLVTRLIKSTASGTLKMRPTSNRRGKVEFTNSRSKLLTVHSPRGLLCHLSTNVILT